MSSQIRVEKGGITFRLFSVRAEAIGFANQMTRSFDAQYNAVPIKESGGFIVHSVFKKETHDAAGLLPAEAVALLKNKGSYFEWVPESVA